MSKSAWLVLIVLGACGGDDGGGAPIACSIEISGDVTEVDQCRADYCLTEQYGSLHVSASMASAVRYTLESEVDAPAEFTAGQTYTLAMLNMGSVYSVVTSDKSYVARGGATPVRSADETAELMVQRVRSAGCDGEVDAFISADLVEAVSGVPGGAGRVHLEVQLGNPQ